MTARWWRGRGPVAVVVCLCLLAYAVRDVARYVSYHAPAYDLGFFDQLVGNLAAGRGWASSFIGYDFRGQHWEPILLVWAQLDRLVATPLWLLLVNSIALALAPLAAWRLARIWLGTASLAAPAAALATALSPIVLRTAAFDYHSEALTPLLTLLALDAAARRRWLTVAACCGVLILLKEDAFLVVAGIGWLVWRAESRRAGLLLSAAALAAFAVVVGVFMPWVRQGRTTDVVARYAYLAAGSHPAGPLQVATGSVLHPGAWLAHLTTGPALQGLAIALLPLALLPLLSGWAVLAAAPVLAVALLSSDPLQSSLQLHYGAEAFALLLACALLGWRRLRSWGLLRRFGRRAEVAFLIVALAAAVVVVPIRLDVASPVSDLTGIDRSSAVGAVLDRVPAGVAVAASTGLVAHLSQRPHVTEFPDVRGADWVVIDSRGRVSLQALGAGYEQALGRLSRDFHVVDSAAGVTLWERS